MGGYELIPLTAAAVDLFPADIRPVILKNIHYGHGMYEAAMLFNPAGELIGAGGVRRNEEGLWVAWLWSSGHRGEEADKIKILRLARRWLRDWQYEHDTPIHGVVLNHNRAGKRLVTWLNFVAEARCVYYRNPENDFEIWKREVNYATGGHRINGIGGVEFGNGADAERSADGTSG